MSTLPRRSRWRSTAVSRASLPARTGRGGARRGHHRARAVGRIAAYQIWYVAIVNISTNVLADVVVGVGLLVSLYYGFTGIACAVFFRRELHKSLANLLTMGVLPIPGALILFVVFARGMVYSADPNNVSSQLIWGLGIPDWIVILLTAAVVVTMLVVRVKLPDLFRRERRLVAGEPFPTA